MTDQTPRTEAGRNLMETLRQKDGIEPIDHILAIEAQARTEALDVGREVLCPYCSQWFAILAGETE